MPVSSVYDKICNVIKAVSGGTRNIKVMKSVAVFSVKVKEERCNMIQIKPVRV